LHVERDFHSVHAKICDFDVSQKTNWRDRGERKIATDPITYGNKHNAKEGDSRKQSPAH
jgi:hypothetical protein